MSTPIQDSPYYPFGPKRIVCAAIRNGAGDIICGPRHSHCYLMVPFHRGDWSDPTKVTDGFVDQDGEFYDRKQAAAHVARAQQVLFGNPSLPHAIDPEKPVILTSEDLY